MRLPTRVFDLTCRLKDFKCVDTFPFMCSEEMITQENILVGKIDGVGRHSPGEKLSTITLQAPIW